MRVKQGVSLFIIVIISTISILGSLQYGIVVLAQPTSHNHNSAPNGIQQVNNDYSLTSSGSITIYLPAVFHRFPTNLKKGIGAVVSPACVDMGNLSASWYLNWQPAPDGTCDPADSRFVPRIGSATAMARVSEGVANAQYSGWLIGFNEPNLPFQSNISPEQAAILWKQIEAAAIPAGVKLVSPGPSQHNPGELDPFGNQWLWAMVDAYRNLYGSNPHFDAIGWNLYGCINNPSCLDVAEMQAFLIQRRQEAQNRGYNVPIWVLEFGGCQTTNSLGSDLVIMTEMSTWFDETPWIDRYAWFSNRSAPTFQGDHNCILVNSDGSLTTLGTTYRAHQ